MMTIEAMGATGFSSPGTFVDLAVIALVIGTLILKEVSTSVPSAQARLTARVIDIVLVPMLALYASLVIARLLKGLA